MTMYPYYPTYQNHSGLIWISSEQEAAMYPVAPNNAVTLWSQTEPVVYLKQADASGRPSIKVYDLTERVTAPQNAREGSLPDYATKSDLTALNAALEAIRGEMETMRGDLYGLAGKKKPARKEEEE